VSGVLGAAWKRDTLVSRAMADQVEHVVRSDRVAIVLMSSPKTHRLISADIHVYHGGEDPADDACVHLRGKPCVMQQCIEWGSELWKRHGPDPKDEAFWAAMERMGETWTGS
jgi:hypothetical protein